MRLDQLQYDHGEGPCVESARPDGPAIAWSQDLAGDPRWPSFGPGAARHGYHSVLATALVPDARPPRLSGALNIYSSARARSTPGRSTSRSCWPRTLPSRWPTPRRSPRPSWRRRTCAARWTSRDVIGQAKGILMQRRGITADEAFDVLRRASQDLNVKLADLARTLATRHAEVDLRLADR